MMPTAADVLYRVTAIIAAVADCPVDEISSESRLVEDLDLDSLEVVEIAVRAEEEFGRPIDDSLLAEQGVTVSHCAHVVQKAHAKEVRT
ncbi:phosphopantetheine-binding protein [Streptomyces sp. NBC_01214]|uniref:acyl carrier protein n=1 Tax=Streptomyces sp. NBC_01214 TaxID=2903777 RepID=UPI0022544A9F|nr:phosphopantetheine-binding protein [Streptomyces sp. NBC_01214]MCX4807497.1 phosphopantetheine-binding protein [Streptomyces sp. NBC_01214]